MPHKVPPVSINAVADILLETEHSVLVEDEFSEDTFFKQLLPLAANSRVTRSGIFFRGVSDVFVDNLENLPVQLDEKLPSLASGWWPSRWVS